jgi:hypothetical protein
MGFAEWADRSSRFELIACGVYFMTHVLPCLTGMLLAIRSWRWYSAGVALALSNGFFCVAHVCGAPSLYEYYHHPDSTVFPRLPWGYRLSSSAALAMFATLGSVLGVDDTFFASSYLLALLGYLRREGVQSKGSAPYTSWNPLAANARWIGRTCSALGCLGAIDRATHRRVHHREGAEGTENAEDWIGLRVPRIWRAWDRLGDGLWLFGKHMLGALPSTRARMVGIAAHMACWGATLLPAAGRLRACAAGLTTLAYTIHLLLMGPIPDDVLDPSQGDAVLYFLSKIDARNLPPVPTLCPPGRAGGTHCLRVW